MSWTTFLTVVFIVYLVYYGLNLLYDLFKAKRLPETDDYSEELFFTDDSEPELIELKSETSVAEANSNPQSPKAYFSSGPVASTGGVGLKQLFFMAKDNLIEFTRTIPY